MLVKAGATVLLAKTFHEPTTGAAVDPTGSKLKYTVDGGSNWTTATDPSKQNSETGYFGTALDTTGFSAGPVSWYIYGTVGGVVQKSGGEFSVVVNGIDDIPDAVSSTLTTDGFLKAATPANNEVVVSGAGVVSADAVSVGGTTVTATAGTNFNHVFNNDGVNTTATIDIIASAGGEICYAPTTATRIIGDDDGGTVSDMGSPGGAAFVTGEDATTGLEVAVSFEVGSLIGERLTSAIFSLRYSGVAGHSVDAKVYNYDTASYDTFATLTNATSLEDYEVSLALLADGTGALAAGEPIYLHPTNFTVDFNFKHSVSAYNAAHYLSIDYGCVKSTLVAIVPTVAEIWEYLINGTQAQTRLETIDSNTAQTATDTTAMRNYQHNTSTALPASFLDGAGTVTVTVSRTLGAAEYIDLYALAIDESMDVLLGSIDQFGWAQDIGWNTVTSGRFVFLVDADVTADTIVTFSCDVSLNALSTTTITYRFTVPPGGIYACIDKDGAWIGAYRVGQTLVPLLALDPAYNYVDVNADGEVATTATTELIDVVDDVKYIKYRIRFPNKKGLHG